MTWGQIRLLVQTSFPEVSLDLIDGFANARYLSVLEATDWIGLKAHAIIQTLAAYQSNTDTVTVTIGSLSVSGAGTAWNPTTGPWGPRFYVPGDTVTYAPTYVSATEITLDRPYEGNGSATPGTVNTGMSYVFMQNIYPLPSDCRSMTTLIDPVSLLPMQPFTKDGLDQCAGPRTLVGYPRSWAQYDDTPESSPPVLHQVELYPPPLQARGYPLEYIRDANFFTGENTSTSPLPFVSSTVILEGARADCALHLEKYTRAEGHELAFRTELGRLLLVEHSQRRVKTDLKMAARFTRHRFARAIRGYGSYGGMPNPPINQP